jgi:hypothetical protein
MGIQIEPYTSEEQAAPARAFNERVRPAQPAFYLAERPPSSDPPDSVLRNHFYLAREEGAVRGGFLIASFPAEFGDGRKVVALNTREPISEALVNPKYSLLGLQMLKYMERQGPYLFALGIGGENLPFSRLLKGAQWKVSPVPFLFRVVRSRRFLLQLRTLRSSAALTLVSRVAAYSGLGSAGIALLQRRAVSPGGLSVEPVERWGDWVEELWTRCRGDCSFAVSRDLRTVMELYPPAGRERAYVMRQGGRVTGWMSTRLTRMRDHKYFGDLTVGTLMDGVVEEQFRRAAVTLVSKALAREGAELLVTNQSHSQWVAAFRGAGYLTGPSNYILALSKQLAGEISAQAGGFDGVHFTRGDSDGRFHL